MPDYSNPGQPAANAVVTAMQIAAVVGIVAIGATIYFASKKPSKKRKNPLPASEITFTKRRIRRQFNRASVPEVREAMADLHERVFDRAARHGTLHKDNMVVQYGRAEEEELAEILRERLAKDKDLNATRHNPKSRKRKTKR